MSKIGKKIDTDTLILQQPRITEKATTLNTEAVYCFEVAPTANKITVARAIKNKYKVVPRAVNIVNLPAKKVLVKGRRGVVSGLKKAFVYLQAGDKIELV